MEKLPENIGHLQCAFGITYIHGDKNTHYHKCLEAKINELVAEVNVLKGEPELRLEKWVNENKEEEIHYFLGNTYLFGYNPKFVSEEEVQQQLRRINERRSSV